MNRGSVSKVIRLSDLLIELYEADGTLRQTDLRKRVDKSKSTVHRGIRELEEMKIAKKDGPGYCLPEFGKVIAERTKEYISEVETADEFHEFLGTVEETDLRLKSISDGTVTRTSRNNPVAPLMRLAEITAGAKEIHVLTNSIAPESFEVGRQGIRVGNKEVEMIVDRRTIESIRGNEWFGEELEKDLRTGNLSLWVHENMVPHQIGVIDGRLCLGAEDDNRMPVAMLETENRGAVRWAEGVIDEYRSRACKFRLEDI